MAENNVKVNVILVEYICDSCELGRMNPTGEVLPSYPAQYVHRCSNCADTERFTHRYPYNRYEKVN